MADALTIVGALSGVSLLLNAATVFAAGRAWGRLTERVDHTRADVKEVRRDLNGVAKKLSSEQRELAERLSTEQRELAAQIGHDLEFASETHLRDYHFVRGPRAATDGGG